MGYPEIHILMQMVPSFYALEIIGMGLWLLGQTENSISWQTQMNSAAMQMIQLRTLRMLLTSSGASCPSHDLIKLGRNSSSNSLLWSDDSLRIRNQNDKLQPRYLHGSGCCRHGSWNVWCDDQIQCWAICMSTVSVCMSFLIHMTCVYLCTLHVSIYAYYLIYMYIILTYIIGRQKDRNRRIHKHGPKPKQCQTA